MLSFFSFFLLTCIFSSSVIAYPAFSGEKSNPHYGYESCPTGSSKPNDLNIHLICHTHDDVGWLKTVDQYYYGTYSTIQRAGVQYILDSVVESLRRDPKKKFIYVEVAFFTRWWNEQPQEMKVAVKELVCNGQLEFINGGWSMNDEAATHYNSIIDQMTWGLRFLNDTFGKCGLPKVAWQIDPFGHSKEQASLFAQMSFDGLFFGRLDFEDKNNRLKTKTMEMIWKANSVLGQHSDLFTGVLRNGYDPPPGFCFDIMCNNVPIMDDPALKMYNVDDRITDFIEQSENQAQFYATNHIAMTMGSDFHYQYAGAWFKNLDKLIFHTNKRRANGSRINVFYSTPSCYLYALNKAERNWTVKFDDFFPYSSDPHAFWSGYFTSRPSLKRYERMGNNNFQISKQLAVKAKLEEMLLNNMRDAMGIMQHHDAITGTAKQHVTNDYYETLATGIKTCQDTISKAYEKLIPLNPAEKLPEQIFCNYLNISECEIMEQGVPVAVTIYNPLAWNVSSYIRLPVNQTSFKVTDPEGKDIPIQIIPLSSYILNIPGRNSTAKAELVFKAELLPLGHSTYIISNTTTILYSNVLEQQRSRVFQGLNNGTLIMKNKFITVTIGNSGLLESLQLASGKKMAVNQTFYWYQGMNGNNKVAELRASGAYIFRPNGTTPFPVSENVSVAYVNGSLVQEIHQYFCPWLSQTIRLYHDREDVELNFVVGPIPVEDHVGKEIITRFDTDLQTEGHFFTDANGRQILERIQNFRPSFNLTNLLEPVAGNYYPVNSRIFIRDKKTNSQFTVLNDRSQGGASINNGSVELMLHRRLLHDDAFGVDEALNETEYGQGLVIIGSLSLIFSDIETAASKHRPLAQKLFMEPQISFGVVNSSEASYMQNFKMMSSGLKTPFPPNVHLLTLEPWKSGSVLIRVEHMYDFNEDIVLSKNLKLDLKNRFVGFDIVSLREVTLGANQFSDEAKRLQWHTEYSYKFRDDDTPAKGTDPNYQDIFNMTIPLSPMRIRSFIAEIEYTK